MTHPRPAPRAVAGADIFCGSSIDGSLRWWALLAKRFAFERETVMTLHQPVEHGVSHRLVADPLVPVFDGQLAGDDRGAVVRAVIDDLQQIGSGLPVHGGHSPVVQQQYVRTFERIEPARKRAVGVPNSKFLTQAWNPLIQHAVSTPTGMLGQGTRDPRFARARGAGDQHSVT